MAVNPSSIKLEMELSAGVWTNVYADARSVEPLRWSYGMRGILPQDRVAGTGSLTFSLDNSESNSAGLVGYYSVGHANKRAGFAIGVRVRLTISYSTKTYLKFLGRLVKADPEPGLKLNRIVRCEALDFLDDMAIHPITRFAVQAAVRSDAMFDAVLGDMRTYPPSKALSVGQETFTYAGDDLKDEKTTPLTAAQRIAMSEFGYVFQRGGSWTPATEPALDSCFQVRFDGTTVDRRGLRGTRVGPARFVTGKHSQAVQLAEAMRNKCLNPSAEVDTTNTSNLNCTVTRDATEAYIGSASFKVVHGAGDSWFKVHTDSFVTGGTYAVQARVKGTAGQNVRIIIYDGITEPDAQSLTLTGGWDLVQGVRTISGSATELRVMFRSNNDTPTMYIDAVQCEEKAYPTPYGDGSLTDGHKWTGTADASASERMAARLEWADTRLSVSEGSMAFWVWAQRWASTVAERIVYRLYPQGTGTAYYLTAGIDAAGLLYGGLFFSATDYRAAWSSTGLSEGFHFVVVTWKVGAASKLYVDGTLRATAASTLVTPPTPNTTLAYIGADYNATKALNGWLDDLTLLNHQLTDSEASALYTWAASNPILDVEDRGGTLVFEDRHTRTKKTAADFTITDIVEMELEHDRRNVYNRVTATAYPRQVGASPETLADLQRDLEIGPYASERVVLQYSDPSNPDSRVSATAVYDPEGANLVLNRGAEAGLANWGNANGITSQASDRVKAGLYSGKFVSFIGSPLDARPFSSGRRPAATGDVLYCGMWVNTDDQWPGEGNKLYLAIHEYPDDVGSLLQVQFVASLDTPTNGWKFIGGKITVANASTTRVILVLRAFQTTVPNFTTAKTIWVDEVFMVKSGDLAYEFSSTTGGGGDKNVDLALAGSETGGNAAEYILQNMSGTTGFVTKLQPKGTILRLYEPAVAKVEDEASILTHGPRDLPAPLILPYQDNPFKAEDWATVVKNAWKDPQTLLGGVTLIANKSNGNMLAALGMEPTSRVTVQESVGAINADYFVNGLEYTIMRPDVLVCRFWGPRAGTEQYWLLGSAGSGELGTKTVLGF